MEKSLQYLSSSLFVVNIEVTIYIKTVRGEFGEDVIYSELLPECEQGDHLR